jgi:hypothetical protein
LAFPKGEIASEVLQPYLGGGERYEDTLTVKEIGERCIVHWARNEEGGWWGTNGDGIITNSSGSVRSCCAAIGGRLNISSGVVSTVLV